MEIYLFHLLLPLLLLLSVLHIPRRRLLHFKKTTTCLYRPLDTV